MIDVKSLKNRKGPKLYLQAKRLIPGGTQLLSKRPEMFAPDVWPAYYSKAKGCRVWDMDNKEYIDMSIMAVGACILGYADDDIDDAVMRAIRSGVNSSLNCPEEVELAEALIDLHPWFDMVRYARSGGEALSVAVRIARAKTGRETILFSGYHGWSDWYLAANLSDDAALDGQLMPGLKPSGVPRGLAGTAIPFNFNDIDSLREKIKGQENEIAAIMIEPARGEEAPDEYLSVLREIASEIGAVLIFDEITSGFRMCAGGIHRRYNIHPDMAIFAKSMANGYAMSAIIGTEDVMQAAQSTFISSTNWTDKVGPAAALATLKKYEEQKTDSHIISIGNQTQQIWRNAALNSGLEIDISGLPSLSAFSFKSEHSQALNTRFVIEMLQRGFLGFRQFKPSLAHSNKHLDKYSVAVQEVFNTLVDLPEHNILNSEVAHAKFSYLTKE
jgi:glutamate-1-semialdehyde aminotransferase